LPKVVFFLKKVPEAGARDVIQLIGSLLYGGKELGGILATFWFISCLFFTQQLYHFLYLKTLTKRWLFYGTLILLYLLAILNSGHYDLSFPWNINVVALTIFYFYFGHLARRVEPIPRGVKAAFIFFIFLAIALDLAGIINYEFDMRFSFYGYPVFNLAIGVSCSLLFQELSKVISRFSLGQKILSEMGRASLVIMFLHMAVIKVFKDAFHFNSAIFSVILGLAIPCLLYRVFRLFPITRKLFLGDLSKEPLVGS
jgi:fucose 4-O-acetylase-like acetyltransferase